MENVTAADLETCLRVLQLVADDPLLIRTHERFKSLVTKIARDGKKRLRQTQHQARVARDQAKIDQTGIVQQQLGTTSVPTPRRAPLVDAPLVDAPLVDAPLVDAPLVDVGPTIETARHCYVCKQPYQQLHFFYHAMCPPCAALNWQKRHQQADLTGRTALLTGGRIKIGYQLALKLLRDGAKVFLTTRFPHDAARRFHAESDAHEWASRLAIYGLELRDLFAVEAFAAELLDRQTTLDIVIHNAAQTVKRPLAFYQHLLAGETAPPSLMVKSTAPMLLEMKAQYCGHIADVERFFPLQLFDRDGQQVDRRPENSWRAKLGSISTIEMLEVLLVNTVAPFVLDNALLPLLRQSPHARRFIVHVSAMEGQFARATKTAFHPHTNMAKAALNMLTRTTATDLAKDGIYINSVDTGWITDENPLPQAETARDEHGFRLPLDLVDGAARIYDPLARGVNEPGEPLHGHFLKDYAPYPW